MTGKTFWSAAAVLMALAVHAETNTAYLTASGGDDATAVLNDADRPFATLSAAEAALGEEGGTVSVAKGVYTFTDCTAPDAYQGTVYSSGNSCFVVTNAIRIVGATGNPADVIFERSSDIASARVFLLDHEDAVLKGVTVRNGCFKNVICNGGNVLVGHRGGTVEDCILENGYAGDQNNTNIGGGNISLLNGRCSRCLITGGTIGHYRPIGLNVCAAGWSVVENCLITKGKCTNAHEAAADEGAVALKEHAALVNCTVVGNSANRFAGVNILSEDAKAVNCVIFGNTVTYESNARDTTDDTSANGVSKNGGYAGNYLYCGTDLDTAKYPQLNQTCFRVRASDFADAANGNWIPSVNASLRDRGREYSESGAVSETDLAGNVREQGWYIDVGCYELVPSFHFDTVSSDADSYVMHDGKAVATFTAVAADADGVVLYTWDFGDGTEITTDQTEIVHEYTVDGAYAVTVVARCGDKSVEFAFIDRIVVSSFVIEVVRSGDVAVVNAPVEFSALTEFASPVTYTWDFGDGTDRLQTGDTTVEHVYTVPGSYAVTVVADGGYAGRLDLSYENDLLVFSSDVYVNARSGTPTLPYATPQTAAKSLSDVWNCLQDGMTLHIAPGTYQTKGWEPAVDKRVKIVGEGATPGETVLHNGYANFKNGMRNLSVRNDGALVANLTLAGGFASYAAGGNLLLESGVVSNCVLASGGTDSHGGMGGGAYVSGGVLTHCIVTNSYLGNRGKGIVIRQSGGRVSNCLISRNRRSWSSSRNATSLYYADGGVVDNCTIADCWICRYNPNNKLQMDAESDKGVEIGGNARAWNLAIADIRWDIVPGDGEDRDELLAGLGKPQRWAGTAANFANCATDDEAPINDACATGTLEAGSLFADYAGGVLLPGLVMKNRGTVVADLPSVDLAGNRRLWREIDIGCYECQPNKGTLVRIR